jgi:tetratricopeptide (TPR) repeat protein
MSINCVPGFPLMVGLLITFALVAAPAAGQIPDRFANLQVLPRDTPRADLVQRMRGFSFALNVRCEYCHEQPDANANPDFASDARPAKNKAREMLRMVQTINSTLLPRVPSRVEPRVEVGCETCHHGLAIPKSLQNTLLETIQAKGAAAATAQYRDLRKSTMASGRYNFGEWEINELARRLEESGNHDAAQAMLEMNAEFYPESASIDFMLGELLRARGETEKAIARYRAVLAKAPQHEGAKRRLSELTK